MKQLLDTYRLIADFFLMNLFPFSIPFQAKCLLLRRSGASPRQLERRGQPQRLFVRGLEGGKGQRDWIKRACSKKEYRKTFFFKFKLVLKGGGLQSLTKSVLFFNQKRASSIGVFDFRVVRGGDLPFFDSIVARCLFGFFLGAMEESHHHVFPYGCGFHNNEGNIKAQKNHLEGMKLKLLPPSPPPKATR